jgi:hypothetical protein
LVMYQIDKGKFPEGCGQLWNQTWLILAWLDDIPEDPGWATVVWKWIVDEDLSELDDEWQYWYCAVKKNDQDEGWFVVMSVAETEWWANYVICSPSTSIETDPIASASNFTEIQSKKCTSFTEWSCSQWTDWECGYENWEWQLRYIYLQ